MLWIDGVGGFLALTANQVMIGQPSANPEADIAVMADISRRHAAIVRDAESYLLAAYRETRVAGRAVVEPTPLADEAEIELGKGVRLRFRRPHAFSRTARIELASGHRASPPADAVVLFAESCVLGPNAASHVICPMLDRELVLFRRGDDLLTRYDGAYFVDGRAVTGACRVGAGSRVASGDFAMSLEPA